ncbi:hypothetical protein ED352_12825 [Muribaculaceae bacterium Isolate-002 (NCI)]|nr:hypothetical protein ED352_12825 [Muribaculaceae bacterium Isolate-002 (NCI)]
MNASTVNNINEELNASLGRMELDNIMVLASPHANSSKVLYMLMPVTMRLRTLQQWSSRHGCNIVAVSGFDWDNDMTPWSAPNISLSRPPFMGHAESFLHLLTNHIIPASEEALGLDCGVSRTLGGISLSGLFTLWTWLVDNHFANIGSISGSFWYDGLVDWVDRNVSHKEGRACFSLGALEGGMSGNARFANIQEETRHVVSSLGDAGIDTTLVSDPGNHFAPVGPRIEAMLNMLYPATA